MERIIKILAKIVDTPYLYFPLMLLCGILGGFLGKLLSTLLNNYITSIYG